MRDNLKKVPNPLFRHEIWLDEHTKLTDDQKIEVISLVNDAVTTGIKIGQSIEFRAVQSDPMKAWDYIDEKKLRIIKRVAGFKEEN